MTRYICYVVSVLALVRQSCVLAQQSPPTTEAEVHAAIKAANPNYTGTGTVYRNDKDGIWGVEISKCKVSTLEPLRGMPLTVVACADNDIKDLTPIKGMKLVQLNCSDNPITDLSPISGMPIWRLDIKGTKVTDLTPLKGMKLQDFVFSPENIIEGIDIVRNMKTIQFYPTPEQTNGPHFQTLMNAEKFWKHYDEQRAKKPMAVTFDYDTRYKMTVDNIDPGEPGGVQVEYLQGGEMKVIVKVKGATISDLSFTEPCELRIAKDKTLFAIRENIIAKDAKGKSWKSRKVQLDNKEVYAFFQDSGADAERSRTDSNSGSAKAAPATEVTPVSPQFIEKQSSVSQTATQENPPKLRVKKDLQDSLDVTLVQFGPANIKDKAYDDKSMSGVIVDIHALKTGATVSINHSTVKAVSSSGNSVSASYVFIIEDQVGVTFLFHRGLEASPLKVMVRIGSDEFKAGLLYIDQGGLDVTFPRKGKIRLGLVFAEHSNTLSQISLLDHTIELKQTNVDNKRKR